MKRAIMLGLLALAASSARANTVVVFFADFEDAAKNTRITAANRLTTIEPGTAIGSWEILNDRPGTRVMDTAAGAALQMRTGFYHFKGHLDGAIDLAETPAAIGFDFRVGADTGATDWTLFRVQNSSGQNIAAFRLRNGPIQVYDYATTAWTDVSAEAFTPLAFSDNLADGLMDALEIRIEGAQTTYYANGNQVYAHASSANAHSVATFDVVAPGTSGTESTWFDNISASYMGVPAAPTLRLYSIQ